MTDSNYNSWKKFQSPISGSQTVDATLTDFALRKFQSPISGSQTPELSIPKKPEPAFQSPISGSQTDGYDVSSDRIEMFQSPISGSQTGVHDLQVPGVMYVSIPYKRVTNYRPVKMLLFSITVSIPYKRVTNVSIPCCFWYFCLFQSPISGSQTLEGHSYGTPFLGFNPL